MILVFRVKRIFSIQGPEHSRTCLFVNFHDFRDSYLLVNLVNSTDMNDLNTAGDHVIVTRRD